MRLCPEERDREYGKRFLELLAERNEQTGSEAVEAAPTGGEMPVVTCERETSSEAPHAETGSAAAGNQAVTDDPGNNDLKPAPVPTVDQAIVQAYDEAGDERPNVNKIVKPVKAILRNKGYKAARSHRGGRR